MPKWFVRRPHALLQFGKRAKHPSSDPAELEAILRTALDAVGAHSENFKQGVREREFALRIALDKCEVVYAIVKDAADDKDYDYVVPTVLTQEMYQSWCKDGKLGTVQDLPITKRELPQIKATLYLRYTDRREGNGTPPPAHFLEFIAEDIPDQLIRLLDEGIPLNDIKVLQEVPVDLQAVLRL
ncbi:MAG: hypothetical protein CMK74_02190 [Pseudomonadales bacterium]|jgi:hypothetical protein|nr:hypothetical protein [Pseudomonadales bacterium]|tara:strand:- start:315 stop:866 length:552 start_codon:yes stop_codon:yes gene_type:complete